MIISLHTMLAGEEYNDRHNRNTDGLHQGRNGGVAWDYAGGRRYHWRYSENCSGGYSGFHIGNTVPSTVGFGGVIVRDTVVAMGVGRM